MRNGRGRGRGRGEKEKGRKMDSESTCLVHLIFNNNHLEATGSGGGGWCFKGIRREFI